MIRTMQFCGPISIMIDEFYDENMKKFSTRVWLVPEGIDGPDARWMMLSRELSQQILEWVNEQGIEPTERNY